MEYDGSEPILLYSIEYQDEYNLSEDEVKTLITRYNELAEATSVLYDKLGEFMDTSNILKNVGSH